MFKQAITKLSNIINKKRANFLDHKFPARDRFGAFLDPRTLPRLAVDAPGLVGRAVVDDLEKFYIQKFRASQNPSERAEIMEEFVAKLDELKNGVNMETPGLKNAVIKSWEKIEYSKISIDAVNDQKLSTSDAMTQPTSSPAAMEDATAPATGAASPLMPLFKQNSPAFTSTIVQDTEIATHCTSAMKEYFLAKTHAVLFDESYRKFWRISGRDRHLVADHFVSIGVRKLTVGEIKYACLLDSKGLVLDICQVANLSNEIALLTWGVNASSVWNFLSQYLAFARAGGLEVEISPLAEERAVFTVLGPKAAESVADVLGTQGYTLRCPASSEDSAAISQLPNDSCLEILSNDSLIGHVMRSDAVGDSFTFVFHEQLQSLARALIALGVHPAGLYAFDSLRMERGFPRPGVDVTSLATPVKGALIWTLDQEKLRDRKLFGWKQISGQLAKAPSHRRVGFVADEYVHAGCRIVSAPHRRLIGEVTSCAWSPILKKRLCQAFIKPEYAKLDKTFFVSVPFDLPEDLTNDVRARFLRQGMQRRKFRRLVPCRVVAFPVEEAKTAEMVSDSTKRSRRPNPTVVMKRQEGRERKTADILKAS